MSLFGKIATAMTPQASEEDRQQARSKAREAARPGDWLSTILDHHLRLEAAFDEVKSAAPGTPRQTALKQLGVLLTGHAIAEESAIYPVMASTGDESHAEHAYSEQATVKTDMAALEKLDPAGQPFLGKLEEIRQAVAHHMVEEEGTWFPDLVANASAADQLQIGRHYDEAFKRFVGDDVFA